MPKRLVPGLGRTRWAMAACAAAAIFVAFQLWRGDAPIGPADDERATSAPAGAAAGSETTDQAFVMKPAEDFADIADRPLFNRSRRPAPPDETKAAAGAAAAGEVAAAAKIALNGVLLTGQRRVALLRFDNDPKVMHVAEGQEAGGWRIEKIIADRVVVRRNGQASEIILDYKRSGESMPVPLPSAEDEQPPMPGFDEPMEGVEEEPPE